MAVNNSLSLEDFSTYVASQIIWKYMSPSLIIIGTIANILAIIVLLRKNLRHSTTMFYLTVLSIGDILVLYTGLLRNWLRFAFDTDLRDFSNFGCKLHVFLVYFSLDFSTWILVAVTIDRCISVCLPFHSKTYCTMKHAKITVITICLLMVVLNCHLFGTVGNVDGKCKGNTSFIASVWPWIDLCMFCLGPFAVMTICNILIIRQIILSNRRIESHNDPAMIRLKVEPTVPSTSATNHNGHTTPQNETKSKNKKRTKRISNVTIMLLTVNVVYFICTLPIAVYLIGYRFWVPGANLENTAGLEFFWAISNFLQYTNNTIHFFMYCLTSPKIRKELYNLFYFLGTKENMAKTTYHAENVSRMTRY